MVQHNGRWYDSESLPRGDDLRPPGFLSHVFIVLSVLPMKSSDC